MNFNDFLPGVDWNYVVTAVLGILTTILTQLIAARNGVHLAPAPVPKPTAPVTPDVKQPDAALVIPGLPFGGAFLPLILAMIQKLLAVKAGVAELDDHDKEALKVLHPLAADVTK